MTGPHALSHEVSAFIYILIFKMEEVPVSFDFLAEHSWVIYIANKSNPRHPPKSKPNNQDECFPFKCSKLYMFSVICF